MIILHSIKLYFMGQGGNLKIYNATPFNLVQASQHSYQMANWNPPAEVPANASVGFYIEYSDFFFHDAGDDGGDAHYTINGTQQTFWLQARAKDVSEGQSYTTNFWLQYQSGWNDNSSSPLTSPYYMFWSTGDAQWRLLNQDTHLIGWNWNQVTQDAVVVQIVQINQYCANDQDAPARASDLLNNNQAAQDFQNFLAVVNAALAKM
jgi:hypothetical protein